jgi:adenylate kinase
MKLLLLGPPGAGKGTIADMLSEKYNIPHISTGDIFRDQIAKKTELGKQANEYIIQGKYVPDDVTIKMVEERLAKDDCKNGFILDGFPRTTKQASVLENISKLDLVLNLKVSEETIIKRLSARRSCENCHLIYNMITIPPKKEGICDKCNSQLIQREDDKPEVIQKRLIVYKEETEPLIDYYFNEGILEDINAEQTPQEIFEECVKVIEKET